MNSHETRLLRVQTKGDNRFGFTLVGQYPCQLVRIQNGSQAEKAGVKSGDELIEANGVNVEDLKHNCVATFISPNIDGVTELLVRRAINNSSRSFASGQNVQQTQSGKVRCTEDDDLSNAIDQVIEGIQRPDINTPRTQKGLDLSILNSNDIPSDEHLKSNFSPVRAKTKSRMTTDISTPVALSLGLPSSSRCVQFFLGYLGSINGPLATLSSLGLVTYLRLSRNASVWVTLEIRSEGVYVRNSNKQIIMMSPLKSLVYFGICRENKQILALLTANTNPLDCPKVIKNDGYVANSPDCNLNCSCHVFVIDSSYNEHDKHTTLMDCFQLQCDPKTGNCQQYFPKSTKTLLQTFYDVLRTNSSHVSLAKNDFDDTDLNSCGSEVDILRELGVITPQELIKNDHSLASARPYVTQHDKDDINQVLCLYLRPLYENVNMKDEGKDCGVQRDYNVKIRSEGEPTCIQQSGNVTLKSHHIIHITSCKKDDTTMANRENVLNKQNDEGKVGRSGHKTLAYQRSHSLASSVNNALHAAAATAILTAQKLECCSQNLEIGNGVGQLYHASSASMLSANSNTDQPDGRVARWAVAFDRLLEDESGLQVFRSFLQKEFSEENLVFWLACEKYKTLEDKKKLKDMAEEIYEQHLKPCADQPVNVDATAVKAVESNLQEPSSELFFTLQYQVYTLMKFDSYTRFLKSELYQECVVNEMEGKGLPFENEEDKKDEEEGMGTLKRMVRNKNLCLQLENYYRIDDDLNSNHSLKFSSTKGKGRKSAGKQNISGDNDEAKKKSILPWRGRLKSDQPKRHTNRSSDSQASSTRSSLSSLSDSVFSSNVNYSDEALNDWDSKERAPPTCKVILPNKLSMYLFCKSTRSLRDGVLDLCVRHGFSLPAIDVFLGGQKLSEEDLKKKLTRFINKEIILEQRILFRLELPYDGTIGVIAKQDRTITDVLTPILLQNNLHLNDYDILLRDSNEIVEMSAQVSICHRHYLIMRKKAATDVYDEHVITAREHINKAYAHINPTKSIVALDHKVFEGIMMGKRQSMSGFCFDDLGVFVPMVKVHSNENKETLTMNCQEKQLTRSPAVFRKKKQRIGQTVSTFRTYVKEDRKSTEEFFILLHRSQNSRMDDQRGLLNQRNIELPDFLKTQETRSMEVNNLSVGIPSTRTLHQPVKKTTSSPPSYAAWVSKQYGNRPAVVAKEAQTLYRFTRNWSGSNCQRAKTHDVTETQTMDRKKFFKRFQNQPAGRLRAGSLPHNNPEDRLILSAGKNDVNKPGCYYESEQSRKINNNEVVWVSNTVNRNRVRSSSRTDPSGDAGYESTTDDECRSESKTEIIIPRNDNKIYTKFLHTRTRSNSESYFRENMATAKYHVRTLVNQSGSHDPCSGNDRTGILDNSFLKEQLKPARLYSQFSPVLGNTSMDSSSLSNRNGGTPKKCPLFIPHENSDDLMSRDRSRNKSHYIQEEIPGKEEKNEDVNVRVTFV